MERGIRLFISYATKDSERLNISKIADLLKALKNINEVHFWEGWNGFPNGNIIEFMERGINDCDMFISVFTEASLSSSNCQKERDMAIFQNKRIIPLFESFNFVPPACQPYLGVNLTGKSVNDVVFELHKLITSQSIRLKPIEKPEIKPTPTSTAEKKAPFKMKMVKVNEIETLKNLQKELSKPLNINEFEVNDAGSVISLDLSSLTFDKVPEAILSLPGLMEISFSGNSFKTDEELKRMVFDGLVVKMNGKNYADGQIESRIKREEEIKHKGNENQELVDKAQQKFNERKWSEAIALIKKSKEICVELGWTEGVNYAESVILEAGERVKKEAEEEARKAAEEKAKKEQIEKEKRLRLQYQTIVNQAQQMFNERK